MDIKSKEEKEILSFTIVLHQARIQLNLSLNEYCIADCIYNLSNNPRSKIQGWCYASKKHLGELIGLTETSIHSILNKLIKLKIVEKDNDTRYLRTTQLWYDNIVLKRIHLRKLSHTKETLVKTHKKLKSEHTRNLSQDTKESLVYNNTNKNIDKNKDNIAIQKIAHKKQVDDLLDQFKRVNPNHERLFGNKTERASLERMIKKFGLEWLTGLIEALPEIVKQPYAPRITTPYQLESKMGDLKIFIDQAKMKITSKGKKVIY